MLLRRVALTAAMLLPALATVGIDAGSPHEARVTSRGPAPAPTTITMDVIESTADPWAVEPAAARYEATPVVLDAPAPLRIELPDVGVDSALVELGLDADGNMEVPVDFDRAGWFSLGPRPGENGPAVVAGHVDSYSGAAVFHRLVDLRPGDRAIVTGEDGSRITFVVERVAQFSKDEFPTDLVFGSTSKAELRLVTCGGAFDRSRRSYRDNVVVFATLVT